MGLFFELCLWLVILIKIHKQTLKFQNSWIYTVCFNTVQYLKFISWNCLRI